MLLKKSYYNIDIEKLENGETLIYNSLCGSFGILDKKTNDVFSVENKVEFNEISDEEIKNNIKIMINNGFAVDYYVDEKVKMQLMNKIGRFANNSLTLTIAPTIDCNMACPYCYEPKVKKSMDNEVAQKLINFVKTFVESKSINNLFVVWYGGEPLLETERIKGLSKEFIDMCTENFVNYNSHIVTNGSLLNQETAKMLKEECKVIRAQVTIDGLRDQHNKRRLLKNKQDSFDIVTKNVDIAKEYFKISVRVNIDKENDTEAYNLLDFFVDDMKWTGDNVAFYFAPVDSVTEACPINKNQCYNSFDFSRLELDLMKKAYEKGIKYAIDSIYPVARRVVCGAICLNNYVVDPEGYLFKCWNDLGVIEENVGDLDTGIKINAKTIEWMNFELNDTCKKCKTLPICQASCPYKGIRNNNMPVCHHRTFNYKEVLNITYKEYLKNNV